MEIDSKQLFNQLMDDLTFEESREEKEVIVYWVLEHTLELSKTDILAGKMTIYDKPVLDDILRRLNQHEPVQYILGEAAFYGRKFLVNPSVLIPRPETELLVSEIVKLNLHITKNISILDIGTGSGCIAISLALEIPNAVVFASDVSEGALAVAAKNALALGAKVSFLHHDILKNNLMVDGLDVIVSNPPYIPDFEKQSLQRNVRDYEPALALFVQDADPLQFYKVIGVRAMESLRPDGLLITEINERLGRETAAVFASSGFKDIAIHKDISGKDRFVTGIASRP